MRSLAPRKSLGKSVAVQLAKKAKRVSDEEVAFRKADVARRLFRSARGRKWFLPVVAALKELAGPGELCMYCSANESSHVEHYRPVSTFPELAFAYENYLWVCGICNSKYKGDRFPPHTEPGAQILNPLEDAVWDYFLIEEQFGQLIPASDPATGNLLERAISTCQVVGIDRETVQLRRLHRYRALRRDAQEVLKRFHAGAIEPEEVRSRIQEWREQCFQADVADYFLNGPGREKEPFRELLIAVGDLPAFHSPLRG